jgi:hypothetical protein
MNDLLVKTCAFMLALLLSTAVIMSVATVAWIVFKYVKWLGSLV